MISVVVPVYNEEENIEELFKKVSDVLNKDNETWELIFVDDASQDNSISIIKKIAQNNSNVKALRFSRNFGQYAAVIAGINNAFGDAIIIMDADLQEPPFLISELINKWKAGYKAVYTSAIKRNDGFLRRILANFFYKFFGRISNLKNVQNVSEMRLIDKEMAMTLRKFKEKPRFIKGLFFWLGYKYIFIKYEKEKRLFGKSKYSLKKLLNLAFDGIFSFSFLPLRFITYSGMFFILLSFVYGIFIFFESYLSVDNISLIKIILFLFFLFFGFLLISIGILGEYIARIYDEVRQRPNYIIEEHVNYSQFEKIDPV